MCLSVGGGVSGVWWWCPVVACGVRSGCARRAPLGLAVLAPLLMGPRARSPPFRLYDSMLSACAFRSGCARRGPLGLAVLAPL